MKRLTILVTALTVALWFAAPGFAQHGGGGHGAGGAGAGAGQGMGPGGGGQGMGRAPGGMGRNPGEPGMGGEHGGTHGMENGGPSMSTHGKSVDQLLTQNKKLASRLQSLLPAGTDLQSAADGFKNLGQFVAAAEVSHNLGISFDDLKAKMTSGDSLGKAIHALNPAVNAKKEAKKGMRQAKEDLRNSQQATLVRHRLT